MRKRYPTDAIIKKEKNLVIMYDLSVNRKQITERLNNIIYVGICKSVKGKGYEPLELVTTGAIIPVKILTIPSMPRWIREKVIGLYITL
jgi:hypothetical protein